MEFGVETLLFGGDPGHKEEDGQTEEFVFDDEPLEKILYGEAGNGPTRANLFWPVLELVEEITRAFRESDVPRAIMKASELGLKKLPISTGACRTLALIMESIVPQYPDPVMDHDLSSLGNLLEQIWEVARSSRNPALEESVGTTLYRWYEHHGHYEKARGVQTELLEKPRKRNDPLHEAILINNLAFEYLLERKWREAMHLFEKAVHINQEQGRRFEAANSKANYWICRFECGPVNEIKKTEAELQSLRKQLSESTGWHARKPLILLARIEEGRGNIKAAIELVKEAIESSSNTKTRYGEMDRKYLEALMSKLEEKPSL